MRQTEPQLHPRASYLERGGLASGWMAETTPATPELSGEAAELEKQNSPDPALLSNRCLLIFPLVESYQGGDRKNTQQVPRGHRRSVGLREKPTDSGQPDQGVTPSLQLCEPRGQGLSTAL